MLKVILLYGGQSGEHEVSLRSAASVLSNLDASKYEIIPIAIDKNGSFYLNLYEELVAYPDALPIQARGATFLPHFMMGNRLVIEADLLFPVLHGPLYEDGSLQGLLELANIAYVGCDVLSSAVGMDKDFARRILSFHGIQSAPYRMLSCHASSEEKEEFLHEVMATLTWPLFVKPCCMGSSVGIHKVSNKEELVYAIADAHRYDDLILVEQSIIGRELEISVLESRALTQTPRVSVVGEVSVGHQDGFYSYTAKYIESDQTSLIIPAQISVALSEKLRILAADIFRHLKCRGFARVDFFVKEENEEIYFNEINTLPGFTSISMYPKLWIESGLPYGQLLDELIDLAILHDQSRKKLVTNYQ